MRLSLLVALAGLALAACDSTGLDPQPPVGPGPPVPVPVPHDEILPLAVGEGWVFQTVRTRFDRDTGAELATDTLALPDTVRVVEAVDRGGETWYRLDADRGGIARIVFDGLYTNRPDGLYRLYGQTPVREVAYPARAGDVFAVTSPFALTPGEDPTVVTESVVTVKRTDHPVPGAAPAGVLYSRTFLRARLAGVDYAFVPASAVLRSVYEPGEGYVVHDQAYFAVSNAPQQVAMDTRFRFVRTARLRPLVATRPAR